MRTGIACLDTGTHHNILTAGTYVRTIQERNGLMIACLKDPALANEWLKTEKIKGADDAIGKSSYAVYLWNLLWRLD